MTATTPTTLQTLPGEIRNQIFSLLLPRKSDCITLQRQAQHHPRLAQVPRTARPREPSYFRAFITTPRTKENEEEPAQLHPISIALLRTCKQFRRECAESLKWEDHKFVFDAGVLKDYDSDMDLGLHPELPFELITDLEVEYRPSVTESNFDLVKCMMNILQVMAEEGNLKAITIKAFHSTGSHPIDPTQPINRMIKPFDRHPHLYWGPVWDKYQVKRKWVVTEGAVRYFMRRLNTLEDLCGAAGMVHRFIEGEFWMAEKLCWDNGIQVAVLEEDEPGRITERKLLKSF